MGNISRPGLAAKLEKASERLPQATEEAIALREHRLANGLDLWTGEPLCGMDAENWLHIKDGKAERSLYSDVKETVELMRKLRLTDEDGYDKLCEELETYFNEEGKDGYAEVRKLASLGRNT